MRPRRLLGLLLGAGLLGAGCAAPATAPLDPETAFVTVSLEFET
jgi:hypothetical protein